MITIENSHTHSLDSAEILRFLKAGDELKGRFFNYFNDRMTISEAKKFHERLFEFEDNKEKLLASGVNNPTYRTVQNWYHQWRSLNLGLRAKSGMLKVK